MACVLKFDSFVFRNLCASFIVHFFIPPFIAAASHLRLPKAVRSKSSAEHLLPFLSAAPEASFIWSPIERSLAALWPLFGRPLAVWPLRPVRPITDHQSAFRILIFIIRSQSLFSIISAKPHAVQQNDLRFIFPNHNLSASDGLATELGKSPFRSDLVWKRFARTSLGQSLSMVAFHPSLGASAFTSRSSDPQISFEAPLLIEAHIARFCESFAWINKTAPNQIYDSVLRRNWVYWNFKFEINGILRRIWRASWVLF